MSEPKTEIKFMEFCIKNIQVFQLLQKESADFKNDCMKLQTNLIRSQVKQIESKLIQFMLDYINKPASLHQLIEQNYPQENTAIYFYEA